MSVASRSYAVGIVANSTFLFFPCRHVSRREAEAYARSYNRITCERFAVVLRHPISRAISQARSKSRSA